MNAYELLTLWINKMGSVAEENLDMMCWSRCCGTIMCAGGHATTIPEIRKRGLHIIIDEEGQGDVQFGDSYSYGFSAIAEAFMIYRKQAEHICNDIYYKNVPNSLDIIKHIKEVRDDYWPTEA